MLVSASGPFDGAPPAEPVPPGPPGERRAGPGALVNPNRAGLVLLAAVVLAVFVLARTSEPRSAALAGHPVPTTAHATRPRVAPTTSSVPATTTTTTTTVPPSSVVVLVLNGWTTSHAALYFKNQLATQGYDMRAPSNATTSTNATSEIFVTKSSDEASALAIAHFLGLPSSVVVTPTPTNDSAVPGGYLQQADVVVVVGGDISGRVPAGYPTPTT